MRENGFLEEPDVLGTVSQLLRSREKMAPPRPLVTAKMGERVRDVIALMRDNGISQVPVLRPTGRLGGIIAEVDLLNHLVKSEGGLDNPIDDLIESDYATVTPATRIHLLRNIFNDAKIVVVEDVDQVMDVITKIDLIEYLAERRGATG